jgi:hypothetical protein
MGGEGGEKRLEITSLYIHVFFFSLVLSLIFDRNTHRARAIKRVHKVRQKGEEILFTLNTNAFEFMDFFRFQYFCGHLEKVKKRKLNSRNVD